MELTETECESDYTEESDSGADSVDDLAEIIYENNRCYVCNRYILTKKQEHWDFDRIFSGCCYNDIITSRGKSSDKCKECEKTK